VSRSEKLKLISNGISTAQPCNGAIGRRKEFSRTLPKDYQQQNPDCLFVFENIAAAAGTYRAFEI
jgi:hypothetical protein